MEARRALAFWRSWSREILKTGGATGVWAAAAVHTEGVSVGERWATHEPVRAVHRLDLWTGGLSTAGARASGLLEAFRRDQAGAAAGARRGRGRGALSAARGGLSAARGGTGRACLI